MSDDLRAMNSALLAANVRQHEAAAVAEREAAEWRERQRRLAREFDVVLALLNHLGSEGDSSELEEKMLDAAVVIMRSDMASMQVVDDSDGALRLHASRGFEAPFATPLAAERPASRMVCSVARRERRRIIVPDVDTCDFLAGTPDLERLRSAGVRAMQSTPLISRSREHAGTVLGMLSTHWRRPHEPDEMSLRLMDVLARQAADLLERLRTEEALRESQAQMRIVIAELSHRVKNTLAVVQAMGRQTMRHSKDMAEFQKAFEGRLASIAAAHSLLTNTDWRGATVGEITASELSAQGAQGQVSVTGPAVSLRPRLALAMHMVLHELATNAVKHGGLESAAGRIDIHWDVHGGDGDAQAGNGQPHAPTPRTLTLDWIEHCGHPVAEPKTTGFGTRLIQQLVEYDLEGDLHRDYPGDGVQYRIRMPLSDVT